MELAELLDSEGLESDQLMAWARERAEALVGELGGDEQGRGLLQLLERDAHLDVAVVSVAANVAPPVAVVDDVDETPIEAALGEDAAMVEEAPIEAAAVEEPADHEAAIEASASDEEPALEEAARVEEPEADLAPPQALDEAPSGPQPISAAELPPPPETPRLADGEPEPMLETFDTGAIHLGTPEADALLASTSSPRPEPVTKPQPEPTLEAESAATEDSSDTEDEAEDDLEEIELDELVELDDEELVELDDEPEAPPPPPPSSGPPPLAAAEAPVIEDDTPVRTGDTAAHTAVEPGEDEPENVDLEAPRQAESDDDFDLDFDAD